MISNAEELLSRRCSEILIVCSSQMVSLWFGTRRKEMQKSGEDSEKRGSIFKNIHLSGVSPVKELFRAMAWIFGNVGNQH
jgi:hypothetical protein